jgi:hypothetical protein
MPITAPKVVLRIGSHSEKEYFEKLAKSLDAIMFGGNLLEITPAATSSFLFSLKTKRGGKVVPFFLDPMTYCFGPYIDPSTGNKRFDLDSLKSDKLVKRGSKVRRRSIKDSYQQLAISMGKVFETAVSDGIKCKAVDISSLSEKEKNEMCRDCLDYQWNRVAQILQEDELMAGFADEARPAAVFAPYFFVSPSWADSGLALSADLAARSVKLGSSAPIHGIFCGSAELLDSESYVDRLVSDFGKTGLDGIWFWFDGFDEFNSSVSRLRNFRHLVFGLAKKFPVHNLHGGYFSLMLAHDGLAGISHGVGYGERKPVAQVIGAAAPTVRYYLPPIHMRIGVPELQLALQHVGIKTKEEFFLRVCDCQICKGVLAKGIEQVSAFGEMHKATVAATRPSQTPAAAKMCRFHFLLNRFKEPKIVAAIKLGQRSEHIATSASSWRHSVALRPYLLEREGYIERWARALA